MDTLFEDCSPEDPCYGCVIESLLREFEAGPPEGDDPVAIVRFAALTRLVGEAKREKAPLRPVGKVPF